MRINQSKINITLGCTEYLSNFELHARDVLHSGIIIIGQTHKNEWQRQTLDCITNILVWTPQPFSLSSKQQHTHARTHPPTQAHAHISFMSKHLLPHSKNKQNGKPHRVYVTQTTADLSFKHVGCCSCVVHLGLSQAKTSRGACHTSYCRPTRQTCWVLFMCCSFWFGLKLPRTLNQWLLMNSNWGYYMQFIFIVPRYSDSKTNTPVLKYTVTMSMVVMTVKPMPLYQNVQSQHLWL